MAAMADKENAGGTLTDEEKKNMQIRCLHCARDNTITTKNTWAMDLIDYLPELVSPEDGQQTNFQRASVTLDAGVKIYSYRVDSVHTETFKILGGLGRASNPIDDEDAGELGDGGGGDDDGEESGKRRRRTHELNPQSTLESSLEALNVKKFDLAFTVDPLFHKTSAQFDEGGARGLLLNNLSVYCGCDIVFDSLDVPENALDGARPADAAATVNLGSLQQQLAGLQLASGGERISPTLDAILELLDESPAEDAAAAAEEFVAQVAASATSNGGDSTSLFRPWAQQVIASSGDAQAALGADDGGERQQQEAEVGMEGVAAEYAYGAAPAAPVDADDDFYDAGDDFGGGVDDYYSDGVEDAQHSIAPGADGGAAAAAGAGGAAQAAAAGYAAAHDDLLGEDAIQWLIEAGSNGMVTRAKGWAGASHWKYRAVPHPVAEDEEGGEEGVTRPKKRSGTRRKNDPLDFVALMEQQQGAEAAAEPVFELMPRREAGAPKKVRRAKPAAKTLLPEDHHFDVASLNRYALRPHTAIIAGSSGGGEGAAPMAAGAAAGAGGDVGFGGGLGGFDFGGGNDDDDDDYDNDMGGGDFGDGWGDAGELSMAERGEALEMVQATRRVERVEVNYSRAAKQVDVRSLKELMWRGMHNTLPADAPPSPDTVLQFQDVLATVPEQNAAGRLEDLSVHLCFICVLHLANEHGLAIKSVPELDRLLISNVPTANS